MENDDWLIDLFREASYTKDSTMKTSNTFWMITSDNPNGKGTKVKHPTYAEAVEEADRLARVHPGTTFFLMRAVESFQASSMIRKNIS